MTYLHAAAQTDRRHHERYATIDGVIVALMPHAEILGQMIDVSLGGLSFCYIDSVFEENPSSELIILVSKPHFCLDKMAYQTVADFPVPNEFSFSSIPVRRRCVRFDLLQEDQLAQLEWFILTCSTHGASALAASAPY
jgi:hypothetical protein